MIIKTLVEDTSISKNFNCEHGLSLYINTDDRKILFDVGASGLFLENAKKMDVDITQIDYLIISHGHYDHGGGLKNFLEYNCNAEVFIHPLAFEKHYSLRPTGKMEFIGLEEDLSSGKQIKFTGHQFCITNKIRVFSDVSQKHPLPLTNSGLLTEGKGQKEKDLFLHEQNLIVEEGSKTLLVTGCAHNGIVNILNGFYNLKGHMPDYVIGGFHLWSRSIGSEDINNIDKIGKFLMDTKAKYYTCHCTGDAPYNRLKAIMGDQIDYLSSGSEITI